MRVIFRIERPTWHFFLWLLPPAKYVWDYHWYRPWWCGLNFTIGRLWFDLFHFGKPSTTRKEG